MISKEKLNNYIGQRIGIETSTGKFLYGLLIEVENSSIKIEFLNKEKVMLIPVHSIISLRKI